MLSLEKTIKCPVLFINVASFVKLATMPTKHEQKIEEEKLARWVLRYASQRPFQPTGVRALEVSERS